MWYVIHAFEEKYGGYHGIEDWTINTGTEEEAIEEARELSLDVMNSYSFIIDELENDVEAFTDENMSEDDIEELRYDIYNENVAYEIWKIKSDVYDDFSKSDYCIDDLRDELYKDPEEFIEKYCELL